MAGVDTEYITLNFVGHDSSKINFMEKQTTQMGVIKEIYSLGIGVPSSSLRFVLNGKLINNDETPKTVKMKQCDVIEVYKEEYYWVLEQLDLALVEFKQFRDGLGKERVTWDTLVYKYYNLTMIHDDRHEQLDVLKEIKDMIARYKNKNTDIDSLVESIQGKSVGTVSKKQKEKSSKGKKKRKSPDTKCKGKCNGGQENAESLIQGSGSSQELYEKFSDPIKAEHSKPDLSPINVIGLKLHKQKGNATLDDSTDGVDGLLKSKEAVSASTEITGDVGKTKRTVHDRSQILADEPEKIKKAVSDELREVKETVSDHTKITDELSQTVEALNITKDLLDETKTLLSEELVKNSHLNDKLSSAYQEIDRMRSKILPNDKSDEAKIRLREEVLNNSVLTAKLTSAYQDNNLLRFKILQIEFKKSRDILRRRLKNNLSVIDHLRASPDFDHTPQVQLALSSLHEFSARLLLAEQELNTQYAAMSQTSNIAQEFQFDISGVEPPELGSSYLNLLHRAVLMNQFSTPSPTCPSTFSSHLLSGLATSASRANFSRMALAGNQCPSLAQAGPSFHQLEELSLIQRGASFNSSRQGSGLGFSRQGDNSNFSSQGPGPHVSPLLQKTSSFHQAGATASSFHQAEATASSFHQATKPKKLVSWMKGSGGGANINLKDDDCSTECSICFEEMHESDSLYLKTCCHRFHRVCIKKWMESPRDVSSSSSKKSTCPTCRTEIIEA